MDTMTFQGFPKEGLKFLANLKRNNRREWFTKHKSVYKESVEAPAQTFALEMEELLTSLTKRPMSGKLFRIYRDVRFSKDKTPYNTHVHMSFLLYRRQDKALSENPLWLRAACFPPGCIRLHRR